MIVAKHWTLLTEPPLNDVYSTNHIRFLDGWMFCITKLYVYLPERLDDDMIVTTYRMHATRDDEHLILWERIVTRREHMAARVRWMKTSGEEDHHQWLYASDDRLLALIVEHRL